jgi:hypothetical protein
MGWMCYIYYIGEMINTCKDMIEKPEGRLRRRRMTVLQKQGGWLEIGFICIKTGNSVGFL